MSSIRTVSYDVDVDELSRRGRIGGFTTAARHDTRELTQPARTAFRDKFLNDVDPDHSLPEAERISRADAARRAHYSRMGQLSAISRAAKSECLTEGGRRDG